MSALFSFFVLSLSVYGCSCIMTRERIFKSLREHVLASKELKITHYLIECPYCFSVWCTLLVVVIFPFRVMHSDMWFVAGVVCDYALTVLAVAGCVRVLVHIEILLQNASKLLKQLLSL